MMETKTMTNTSLRKTTLTVMMLATRLSQKMTVKTDSDTLALMNSSWSMVARMVLLETV